MQTSLKIKKPKIIEKELFYQLGGIFFDIQKELGRFCRERQYGDLFETKLKEINLNYQREYPLEISDKKSSFVDFVVESRILVDLKAKPFITKEDYNQVKRYLEVSKKELGLIVNFRDRHLKPRRILNSRFVDSDTFAPTLSRVLDEIGIVSDR